MREMKSIKLSVICGAVLGTSIPSVIYEEFGRGPI
jgi:hypothetical protein